MFALLFLASVLPGLASCTSAASPNGDAAERSLPRLESVRIAEGNHPAWAQADFDDSRWPRQSWWQVDPQGRQLWLRAHVELPADLRDAARPLAVQVSALAAHEAYWNGQLIGASGEPGSSAEDERPGLLDSQHYLPADLLREHNVLALRLSSFHARRTLAAPVHWLALGEYGAPQSYLFRHHLPTIATSGALLLGAVYFAAMFLSSRRERSSLLLALLSLGVLCQLWLELWRSVWPYAYPVHILRLEAIVLAASLSGLLLCAHAADRYAPRLRLWLPASAAAVMLMAATWLPGFDNKTGAVILVGLCATSIAALIGIKARLGGALILALLTHGLIALLLYRPAGFVDHDYYLAAGALVLYLFMRQVHELRRAQRARADAELQSARLQLELLKRQIQPHFLLNSLTALSEWVDTDPATGVRMIESLAGELRALAGMTDQPLIRLEEELTLCRQHLAVMGYRQDGHFELACDGIDPDQVLPPAVLHCLVENALTHQRSARSATLRLHGQTEGRHYLLRLYSPYAAPADTSMPAGAQHPSDPARGRGHAYVRARLREAFGDDWRFTAGVVDDDWVDTLRLPRRADARTHR